MVDLHLLASTDKIMHTERDVSKLELSVNDSVDSSFRQSQYGGRDEIPIISTEFTGDKTQIRKHKTHKNQKGDKGSQSSILTPMFKDNKEEEKIGGNTPTGGKSEFSFG